MYTLKSTLRRGVNLTAVFALAASAVLPAVLPATAAYADALNPLTERSLTLSSSSPGWAKTDGSGNSTYAPPNSGANGEKTGNYFSFKTSTAATVNTMSFQYCTTSAGSCAVPGDNVTPGTDTDTTSDLNVAYNQPSKTASAEVAAGADFNTVINSATGSVKAVPGYTNNNPKYQANGGTGDAAEAAKNVAGNFIVMYKNGGTWELSDGWTASALNVQNADTGNGQVVRSTNNYIVLTNNGGQAFAAGQEVKVLFFATADNYITNPGSGAFYVKINTYNKVYSASPTGAQVDETGLAPATDANVVDGGVTVANVMNQSIQITTKVLETMQFSVGTVDPDTLSNAQLGVAKNGTGATAAAHTPCDPILTAMVGPQSNGTGGDPQNVLQLGNQSAESSLSDQATYATHSYWRLSSNSSAGATVYYSGHTLSNTSGDEIAPIGRTAKKSQVGAEQFGLAIDQKADSATYNVDYSTAPNTATTGENGADNQAAGITALNGTTPSGNGIHSSTITDVGANASYHQSRLDPLVPYNGTTLGATDYSKGSGTIDGNNTGTANFAFDPMSDTVPAAIASEDAQVVDCVTGKMRYIANIAATTPAGIYTTKINYIAAPQY